MCFCVHLIRGRIRIFLIKEDLAGTLLETVEEVGMIKLLMNA